MVHFVDLLVLEIIILFLLLLHSLCQNIYLFIFLTILYNLFFFSPLQLDWSQQQQQRVVVCGSQWWWWEQQSILICCSLASPSKRVSKVVLFSENWSFFAVELNTEVANFQVFSPSLLNICLFKLFCLELLMYVTLLKDLQGKN